MSPRPYSLGKRAAAIDETRRRILNAAADAYRERGITATSMQEVARRADVAAGTVLYHFSTPDALTRAVIAHITDALRPPTVDVFRGVEGADARIAVLISTVYEFWARTAAWVDMFFRERDSIAALRDGELNVKDSVSRLVKVAAGTAGRSKKVRAVLEGLLDPHFYGTLLEQGLVHEEAVEAATHLAKAHLARPR